MTSSREEKKSWKQKQREAEKEKEIEDEKKLEEEKKFADLLNRIRNAIYILILLIVLGSIVSFFYIMIPLTILFILIGLIILLMIYYPIKREIKERRESWDS